MSMETTSDAINNLIKMSLEKEKITSLKDLVDQSATGSTGAYQAAQSINAQSQDALSYMKKTIEGDRDKLSIDKVLVALSHSFTESKDLLQNLTQDIQPITTGDNASASNKQLLELLDDSKNNLSETEVKLKIMSDDAGRLKNRFKEENLWSEEMQKAFGDISHNASLIPQSAADVKNSLDALGTPPESVQRTKASQKIDDLRSLIGALYLSSDILSHRADNFGRGWSDFKKARDEFSDANDSAARKLRDVRDGLDRARKAVDRIRPSR